MDGTAAPNSKPLNPIAPETHGAHNFTSHPKVEYTTNRIAIVCRKGTCKSHCCSARCYSAYQPGSAGSQNRRSDWGWSMSTPSSRQSRPTGEFPRSRCHSLRHYPSHTGKVLRHSAHIISCTGIAHAFFYGEFTVLTVAISFRAPVLSLEALMTTSTVTTCSVISTFSNNSLPLVSSRLFRILVHSQHMWRD